MPRGCSGLRIDASAPLSAVQQEAVVQACGARVVGARIELDACEPAAVPRILDVLAREQVTVAAVQYGAADLQEVFLGLTRTALRDH
jgi:hypothetical protein